MLNLAINVLWLAIGVIVICLVVYLFLYVLKMFISIPDLVEKAIWLIILILILIAALGLLAGGGSGGLLRPFRVGLSDAANPAWTSTCMHRMLTASGVA